MSEKGFLSRRTGKQKLSSWIINDPKLAQVDGSRNPARCAGLIFSRNILAFNSDFHTNLINNSWELIINELRRPPHLYSSTKLDISWKWCDLLTYSKKRFELTMSLYAILSIATFSGQKRWHYSSFKVRYPWKIGFFSNWWRDYNCSIFRVRIHL